MEIKDHIRDDINKLKGYKTGIAEILDKIRELSLVEVPSELAAARWHLQTAIKWLEVLNGDVDIYDIMRKPSVWTGKLGDIRNTKGKHL